MSVTTVDSPMVTVFDIDTPLDRYLAQQREMTAVDSFSRDISLEFPSRTYDRLLPLAKPGAGEQYAFAVDLDACTGCKSCVVACHSLNGLDDDEAWRSVGLLHSSDTQSTASIQHVTTGCHHCVEPACLSGCPVNAYEKDPFSGIVIHLDDQCIGCSYCTLMCPYDVPRYNESRGIVRKCDMCTGRLAAGEAPACVQACPSVAISITLVNTSAVREASREGSLVAGAASSSITAPTTQYRTTRPALLGDNRSADKTSASISASALIGVHTAAAHTPLAVMLVFTQLSVGSFVSNVLGVHMFDSTVQRISALVALLLGVAGIGASTLHLGRPQYAFRVVLGLRHSWLSREAVAFAVFLIAASLYVVSVWWTPTRSLAEPLGFVTIAAGIVALFCSMKIYIATKRAWWGWRFTGVKFALTTVAGGLFVAAASAPATEGGGRRGLLVGVAVVALIKLLSERSFVYEPQQAADLFATASFLKTTLRRETAMRWLLGIMGGLILPFVIATLLPSPVISATATICALIIWTMGELIERSQFFLAVRSSSMPRMLS
jgi:formate dehydrogenase iron-sulfur subunit